METVIPDIQEHQGQEMSAIRFPYNRPLIEEVKKITGIRWSATKRAWLIPYDDRHIEKIKETLNPPDSVDEGLLKEKLKEIQRRSTLNGAYSEKLRDFARWMKSRRYSPNTQKTYLDAVKVFLNFMGGKPAEEITVQDVIRFNNDYIVKNGYSFSYQNQVVNGVKLFFATVENRKMNIEAIHRPRLEKHLPDVLSKEEVKRLPESLHNLKHRTMLSLIYACGLRRSELLNLKPGDILSDRRLLSIRQAKGRKDRVVPLSDRLLDMLREYYLQYKPKEWLFEGQQAGNPYSEKSLESVLKQALQKAGIKKPVTLHWLRHSYATHLLENGTDLRYIQELPGHASSRTTEIYTHVSQKSIQQIRSPFDDL